MSYRIDPTTLELLEKCFGERVVAEVRAQVEDWWGIVTDTDGPAHKVAIPGVLTSLIPHYCEMHGKHFMTGHFTVEVEIRWGTIREEQYLSPTYLCAFEAGDIAIARRRNKIKCLAGWDRQSPYSENAGVIL